MSAYDDLNVVNGMFRTAFQPVADYSNMRIQLAREQNQRAYQRQLLQDERNYALNTHELYRREAHEDEQRMFDLERSRKATQARADLTQLGKSPQDVAKLDDEQAIYLAGELSRAHQIAADAHAQAGAQREEQGKTARGTLLSSGMDPAQVAKLSDEEAIFKAGLAQEQAATRARIAVQGEPTAPDLSRMAATLKANGTDPTGMTPDQVRDSFNRFTAGREADIRSSQQGTAWALQNRIADLQSSMNKLQQPFDRTTMLRTLLNGKTNPKTGTTINPNTPSADVNAYWQSLSPKDKAPIEQTLTQQEDEFNKSAPSFARATALELYRATNNLAELTKAGIVPKAPSSGVVQPPAPPALLQRPAQPSAAPNPFTALQQMRVLPYTTTMTPGGSAAQPGANPIGASVTAGAPVDLLDSFGPGYDALLARFKNP